MAWIKKDKCSGCGLCMYHCPAEAISMNSNRVAVIDKEKCISCGKCVEVCPRGAALPGNEE